MKEAEIRSRKALDTYLDLVSGDIEAFFEKEKFSFVLCPACENHDYHTVFEKTGFSYVVCGRCNTLFVNPRPSLQELNKFYSDSPSTRFWVDEFFRPFAQARREKIFRPRARFVASLFRGMEGMTVGDIGAGFGIFLEELRKMYPETHCVAIEPSLYMQDICKEKGLTVVPEFLENIGSRYRDTFFLLTAFELFEHLLDPRSFLQQVYDCLVPGGYLYMTTLNAEGFDIQVLWRESKSIFPPHHLNFFTPSSMEMLLKNTGFKIQEISTPGELDWDIVETMIQQKTVDAGRFWNVVSLRKDKECKESLQKWLKEFGLSSHMRVVAQKP